MRAIVVIACMLIALPANAAHRHRIHKIIWDCATVRELVKGIGSETAEQMARANGATERELIRARSCLALTR